MKKGKKSGLSQCLWVTGIIIMTSVLCYLLLPFLGYRAVALILLLAVSLAAMSFDILPVLAAAVLSALIWDFFFIPPRFTLHVNSAEDVLLLLMYFVVALINAVLTFKIRLAEKKALEEEKKTEALGLYNTFLNSLSHELRTPIAAVIVASDNLASGSANLTDTNKKELIREISKAAFRLNGQVENLLNMSRIESGMISPRKDWCDITELVYDTVRKIEENSPAQKISININPAIPFFKIDKGMLEQVLYNLLQNAVQYTPPQALISIQAACHIDVLQIIVEENGPGFHINEIHRVFDKFYRLENSKAGGTGLGLSIVKGFTEAQGGRVTLSNRPEGGARFIISIPAETSYMGNLKNE